MSKSIEPLSYIGCLSETVVEGHGITFQKAQPHHTEPLFAITFSEEHARRIVACVNACEGIPNEQLECDNVEFVRIFNERNTLKEQLDAAYARADELAKQEPYAFVVRDAEGEQLMYPAAIFKYRMASEDDIIASLYTTPPDQSARIADLERELENEQAKGIHSCHPNCNRDGCVNRRLRDQIDVLDGKLALAEAQRGELLAFVKKVSEQTPEKPDYWSSCSQCEHNISGADDLVSAIASAKAGAKCP